ncbi:hypothetical protein AB1Y20_017391 [Prymnesium parvum]|uniref:Pectin acetylesterase n=1 Tax=Prymnesium parvum TaxID=97485 RepID=A0AB34JM03_PRYPA
MHGRRLGGHCRAGTMPLHRLPEGSGTCLDGSPAGYYIWKAEQDNRTPKFRTQWVIFLEGGGWCLSPEDCGLRATTNAGSSRKWVPFASKGGILSRCCSMSSMELCNMNKVFVPYCDGASFGGQREISLGRAANVSVATGSTPHALRSDGRAILAGVVEHLIAQHSLGQATDVLLSGCSAGGLAAVLYAAEVRAALRKAGAPLQRFKVAVFSGLFFAAPRRGSMRTTGPQLSAFERQMRQVVEMSNMSLPTGCRAATPRGHAWRCLLGTAPLDALPADLPALVIQSTFDLFHTNCIMAADERKSYRSRYFQAGCLSGDWRRCLQWMTPARSAVQHCSSEQLQQMDKFHQQVTSDLTSSSALQRRGNSAFLQNCNDHCADANSLQGTTIGGVTMIDAFTAWWKASADALPQTHLGCRLNFTHADGLGPPRCAKALAACAPPVRYKDPRKSIMNSASKLEKAMGHFSEVLCDSRTHSASEGEPSCTERTDTQ